MLRNKIESFLIVNLLPRYYTDDVNKNVFGVLDFCHSN